MYKGIITNDKQRFLDAERHHFTIMTSKEYEEIMYDDAESCKKCGVWYWNVSHWNDEIEE